MDETIACQQCGAPARITERFRLDSTAGPIEHLNNHHWLSPPAVTSSAPSLTPPPGGHPARTCLSSCRGRRAATRFAAQSRTVLRDVGGIVLTEEISMRHALITAQLLNQARDAVIAQGEADERLEHQAQAKAGTQPAQPGRSTRVVTLARRVRALAPRAA